MRQLVAAQTRLIAVALGLLFGLGAALGYAQEWDIEYSSVKVRGSIGRKHTPFEIELSCTPARMLSSRAIKNVKHGTDGYDPGCVLTEVSFTVGQTHVHLPKRSIEDLADTGSPASVGLAFDGDTYTLHLRGGDGAASYKARFLIRSGQLVAREIDEFDEDGEFKTTHQEYRQVAPAKKPRN